MLYKSNATSINDKAKIKLKVIRMEEYNTLDSYESDTENEKSLDEYISGNEGEDELEEQNLRKKRSPRVSVKSNVFENERAISMEGWMALSIFFIATKT